MYIHTRNLFFILLSVIGIELICIFASLLPGTDSGLSGIATSIVFATMAMVTFSAFSALCFAGAFESDTEQERNKELLFALKPGILAFAAMSITTALVFDLIQIAATTSETKDGFWAFGLFTAFLTTGGAWGLSVISFGQASRLRHWFFYFLFFGLCPALPLLYNYAEWKWLGFGLGIQLCLWLRLGLTAGLCTNKAVAKPSA